MSFSFSTNVYYFFLTCMIYYFYLLKRNKALKFWIWKLISKFPLLFFTTELVQVWFSLRVSYFHTLLPLVKKSYQGVKRYPFKIFFSFICNLQFASWTTQNPNFVADCREYVLVVDFSFMFFYKISLFFYDCLSNPNHPDSYPPFFFFSFLTWGRWIRILYLTIKLDKITTKLYL